MSHSDLLDCLSYFPGFAHAIPKEMPETIYKNEHYDPIHFSGDPRQDVDEGLGAAKPSKILRHLERNHIIRYGHKASQRNIMYDFSLERMALHQIIVNFMMHYTFDNKQQFIDVCNSLHSDIIKNPSFERLKDEYKRFLTHAYLNLKTTHHATTGTDIRQQVSDYRNNILEFNHDITHRTDSDHHTNKALQVIRDSWARNPSNYEDRWVVPALLEEERIVWKEKHLKALLSGNPVASSDGKAFTQGLLIHSLNELAKSDKFKGLHLKPLSKIPRIQRQSHLIVGPMGAGKSTTANWIRKKLKEKFGADANLANLDTDWIKSVLLDPKLIERDFTQFSSLTHEESSYVARIAADYWLALAREDAAPHLLAQTSKATAWRRQSFGKHSHLNIYALTIPPEKALSRAATRAQQVGGEDKGRIPPTETLLGSFLPTSKNQEMVDDNLEAMKEGLNVTISSSAVDAPTTQTAGAIRELPTPKDIATYDAASKTLAIEDMFSMWDHYFGHPDINVHACHDNEVKHSTSASTAAHMLEYANHMRLMGNGLEIEKQPPTAEYPFLCNITNWDTLCKEMQGVENARALITGLAEQHAIGNNGKNHYSVKFELQETPHLPGVQPSTSEAHAIIAGARQKAETNPDTYLRFQHLGHQLDQIAAQNIHSSAERNLKTYAELLTKVATKAAAFNTPGYYTIKCEPWLESSYPRPLAYLRKYKGQSITQGQPQYVIEKMRPTKLNGANRLRGCQIKMVKKAGRIGPDKEEAEYAKDLKDMRIISEDTLVKYTELSGYDNSGTWVCAPKLQNSVVALTLQEPITLIDTLPKNMDETGAQHTQRGWRVVMPERYIEDLKSRLSDFEAATKGPKTNWTKALHSLFFPDGQPRFPHLLMTEKDFRKEFRAIPQHRDKYRNTLSTLLKHGKLVYDPRIQAAFLVLGKSEAKEAGTYHLYTADGDTREVPGNSCIALNVPLGKKARAKYLENLETAIMLNEELDPGEHIISPMVQEYFEHACTPELPDIPEEEIDITAEMAASTPTTANAGEVLPPSWQERTKHKKLPGGRTPVDRWKGRRHGPHPGARKRR